MHIPTEAGCLIKQIQARALITTLVLIPVLTLVGCTMSAPIMGDPSAVADESRGGNTGELTFEHSSSDVPVCLVTEGDPAAMPAAEDAVWWSRDGNMGCVAATEDAANGGAGDVMRGAEQAATVAAPPATRDEAIARAAERLLPGAFAMLERRGADIGEERRTQIAEQFTAAIARGEDPTFPRIAIRESVVQRCEPAGGETYWRAQLLADYPIGILRGDVAHAQWEERRLGRELDVRMESVDAFLESGRWYDAHREMSRAIRILPRLGSFSTDVFKNREKLDGLRIVRAGGERAVVVPVAGRETVRYRLEYPWGESMVPARGVPVSFRGGGDIAWVTSVSVETNARGEVEVDIVAGTRIGEAQIIVEVDGAALDGSGLSDASAELFRAAGPTLVQRVLVTSERGVTVCVELDAPDGTDAERVREGLERSLDTMGASLAPCGAGVDLLVSVSVVAATEETHGVWLSRVECNVVVFDQRLAEDVGETTLRVKETGERTARDVEVLALHEAGRLIAVFLEPRLARR